MLSNRIVASMLLLGYCVANVIPTDFFLDTEGMSIAPGHDHICVLERQPGIDIGGRPRCWGRNDYKKCDAPPDETFVQIISGFFYSCGITLDQTVRCWGSLDDVPLHGLYSQIAGTRHHVCGVMTDGHLNCWGKSPAKNAFPSKEYMETYGIERFVQVSVSMYHSCALDDKGHVTCWGTDHASGAMVVPTENVEATSDSSNAAAPDEQDFYGFNEFEENEIGLGGDSQSDGSVKNIVFKQISVGPSTTCAIRYDNSDLMCWGNMESLNLHDGTVKGPFRQVSSGRMGVCAIYDTEAMAEAGIIAEQSLICFGRAAFVTPVHENIVFDQILVSSMVCGVVMEDSSLKCYGGGKNNARAIPEELEIA